MSHHFIEFKNVHYKYSNGYEALRGISFRITHGEKVALLGLNGAGKSTILLHTNGLILPTSGEVNIGGIPVAKKTSVAAGGGATRQDCFGESGNGGTWEKSALPIVGRTKEKHSSCHNPVDGAGYTRHGRAYLRTRLSGPQESGGCYFLV